MEVTLATEANLNNQGCLRFSSSPVFSKSQGFKMIFDFAVVFNSCLVIKKNVLERNLPNYLWLLKYRHTHRHVYRHAQA